MTTEARTFRRFKFEGDIWIVIDAWLSLYSQVSSESVLACDGQFGPLACSAQSLWLFCFISCAARSSKV
jgi:hypothetical protein